MMNFEKLIDAVVTLLGDHAGGDFTVLGYQKQAQPGKGVTETKKSAQVYYAEGLFPKGAGSLTGPYSHDITVNVDLTVAMLTKGDLSVLDNPASTPSQMLTAIENMQTGDYLVHSEMNKFFRDVFQILMDARYFDLGISGGVMASRWVEGFKKDPILKNGNVAILTGHMQYTCRMDETVEGETGTEIETIDMGIEFDGDSTVRSGTINDFTS